MAFDYEKEREEEVELDLYNMHDYPFLQDVVTYASSSECGDGELEKALDAIEVAKKK